MADLDQEHLQHGGRSSRRSLLVVFAITLGLLVGVIGSTTLAQDAPAETSAKAFSVTPNVPYMTIDDREVQLDIYAPNSEGPWPVVVAFHGSGARGDQTTREVAIEAAAQGMLVFTPTWLGDFAFPLDADVTDVLRQVANCAVAFAQQEATALGGDPDRTVIHGFSAGSTPAMWAAFAPEEGPIPGCATDASPTPVAGVVAGEGDYFMYTATFDGAFASDPDEMQSQAAVTIDPTSWPQDLDARFFLWTAADGSEPRRFMGDDATGVISRGDPSGSIRADLERLGQLEDGWITLVDAGRLMADRLASAGLDVTLDEYPGGHTTLDKVPELIGYMQAAAE